MTLTNAMVSDSGRAAVARDDQRGQFDRRLLDDRERFLAFAFAGADLLLEAGADGRIVFAAGAFRSRFGCDPESLIGKPVAAVVASEDMAAFTTCLSLLTARGRVAPMALRLAGAERTPYVMSGMTRSGPAGATRLCLSFGTPAGPLPKRDPELCSGAVFRREAEGFLRAAEGVPAASVPMLDLLEVASSGAAPPQSDLAAAILDQMGAGNAAGALGPGRFGLLRAPGAAGAPDPGEIVARLQQAFKGRGFDVRVASAARLALAGDPVEQSTLQAVRALRYALSAFSRGGASAMAGFENGLTGFVRNATTRIDDMRRAIAERRFRLAFQPIVRLEGRTLHHYEALLRPDEIRGLPTGSPADFVSLAEMFGLAEELDWAVFECAREAAARAGAAVAINLSGLSVQSPAFRERLLAGLERAPGGTTPRLLAEVTETAEIEDEAAAAQTIEAVRQRNVPVCIDDFGAGAAAFRYLRRFRVNHVKVDGTYVRQAAESERDRGFVAAMVDLSLNVGAETIAEQIETEAVAEVMKSLGVRYGQGWLFGRAGDLPITPIVPARRSRAV